MKKYRIMAVILFAVLISVLIGNTSVIKASASEKEAEFGAAEVEILEEYARQPKLDFFQLFFSKTCESKIYRNAQQDVTDQYYSKLSSYYNTGNLEMLNEIIASECLQLNAKTVVDIPSEIVPMELDSYMNVISERMYRLVTCHTPFTVNMETDAELYGGIWYKKSSGVVTRVTTPTLRVLYMNTSQGINPYSTNFQTSSYVSNGKGYFNGSCQYGGVSYSHGYTFYYDFGRAYYSFVATP